MRMLLKPNLSSLVNFKNLKIPMDFMKEPAKNWQFFGRFFDFQIFDNHNSIPEPITLKILGTNR
jgi:hypothetical protein